MKLYHTELAKPLEKNMQLLCKEALLDDKALNPHKFYSYVA